MLKGVQVIPKPKCPRCSDELLQKKNFKYCPSHGVLLPSADFEKATSKSFSQYLWTAWFNWRNQGSAQCPDCLTKMILLNPETNRELEIDCCPGCHAIWLDKGEGSQLHLAFLTFEALEHTLDDVRHAIELQAQLAKFITEHDAKIKRYKRISAIGETLSARIRYYFPF